MDGQAITRLRNVELGLGNSGVAVPVGIIDPVELGGETITRAALPDAAFVRDRDVRIGDAVALYRDGGRMTIADVLPLLRTGNEQAVRLPSSCPACGGDLRQRGRDLVCANAGCPPQLPLRIRQMVSPAGFDLSLLTAERIDHLIAIGVLATPADVFKLRERSLVKAGVPSNEAREIVARIDQARNVTLQRLLVAMTGISAEGAEAIASHARSLARVKRLVAGSIARLHGVSIDEAEALVNFMREPRNRRTLAQMARAGVTTARVPPSR